MAELKVYLSEELDKRFRVLAMSIFGYGRGSLSEAAVEALGSWCTNQENHKNNLPKVHAPSPKSDPVARAEERPGIFPPAKEKDTPSVVEQNKNNETAPPDSDDKDGS